MPRPRLALVFSFVILLACLAPQTSAQVTNVTADQTPPIQGAGHDYIRLLNETVNPATGSLSIHIDVPVPPGREITVPFAFTYDSNSALHRGSRAGSLLGIWVNNQGYLTTGGWSYKLPMLTDQAPQLQWKSLGNNWPYTCKYRNGFMFTDLQSRSHSLPMAVFQSNNNGNCVWPPPNPSDVASGLDDYVKSTATANTGLPVTVADESGTVYYFSGTAYPFGSNGEAYLPTWIETRNGNKVTFSGSTVTDTAGRTLLNWNGFGTSGNTVTVAGLSNPYTLTWGTVTHQVNYSYTISDDPPLNYGCPGNFSAPFSDSVVTAITLPNGKQYQFQYDSSSGLLSKIIYPSGGYVRYVWGVNHSSDTLYNLVDSAGNYSCTILYDTPAVQSRFVSYDGTTEVQEQTFTYSTTWVPGQCGNCQQWTNKTTAVVTQDLHLGTSAETDYAYVPVPVPYTPYNASPIVKSYTLSWSESQTFTFPVEQTVTQKSTSGTVLRTTTKAWIDQYLLNCQLDTLDNGLISGSFYTYGSGGQVTDTKQYDYNIITSTTACQPGATAPSSPTKETAVTYQGFAATPIFPTTPSIFDRPATVITYGAGGARLAETDYSYDQTAVVCAGSPSCVTASGHDEPNYSTSYNNRGNATTVTKQCFVGSTACASGNISTIHTYDETGQTTSTTDPNSHTTQYSYADSYTVLSSGQNVSYTPTTPTNAYLTKITNPLSQTQNFTYDYNSAQLTVSKDPNSLATTYVYNDSFARPTLVTRPDGGTTGITYNDTVLTVTTTKSINTTKSITTVELHDGLDHVKQTQLTSDPQGTVYTDTGYDGLGRVYTVSNPYRTGSDPTTSLGTTTYFYDALARKCLEVPPDGTLPSGNVCSSTQPANTIFTTYSGNCTTVIDQTGKSRKSCTDGLGRMTQVFEDPAGANYETDYRYDALGSLLCAAQKGTASGTFTTCTSIPTGWHPRTFSYDSLSRLLTSANPETGTITYKYDSDTGCASPNFLGLLVSKTDARGIRTCAQYDALNRETVLNYSNGDTSITTTYDQSACLGLAACQNIGQRTSVTDAAGSESWAYQVDAANHRTAHVNQRTTSGIAKTSTYYLDLAGNLTQVVYPTGRVVNYTYDAANRPSTAVDGSNGITYATDFQTAPTDCLTGAVCYTPQGTFYALSIGQSSSFTGLNLTHSYNNRLQPNEFKASSTGGNVIDISYNFVDPLTSHNAGHVYGITNNLDTTRSQTFTYDSLNRITGALTTSTHATSPTHCWGETYTVDAWGNLNSIAATNNANYTGCTEESGFSTNADGNNHLPLFFYDGSGNTSSDGVVTNYQWNAESELKSAAGITYLYDGDGRRVSKVGSKLYWYGSGGEILAETNTSGATTAEYIFFGGKRIAMLSVGGSAQYYVEDMLGTSRVVTTNTGVVCYDADFYPFGGERQPYTNNCPAINNYKFEGKERDTETGNDDFGARYYSNRFGRWLSSDWSSVPAPVPYANFTNPQTLNLYAMVSDDPETFADLDGHEVKEGPVKVIPYDVHGTTAEEARADALRSSGITSPEGEPMMGEAHGSMSIDNIQLTTEVGAGTEATGFSAFTEVKSADVDLQQTLVLPNWADRDKATPEEQQSWDKSMAQLRDHENGHLDINRQGAHELDKALPGTTGYGTGKTQAAAISQAKKQVSQTMKKKQQQAVAKTEEKNAKYDTKTKHGLEQNSQ